MPFETTYQGSVNRWECDENDHLNVRFYLQKMHQGLLIGVQKLGLLDRAGADRLLARLRCHHIRYLQEARIAAPLTGECALVHWNAPHLQLLSQLRHSLTGEVMASFVSDFELDAVLAEQLERAQPSVAVQVPDHAAARGVAAAPSPYAALDLNDARTHGYHQVGAGVVQPEECDGSGALLHWHYMGRTSDAMPNFWALTQSPDEPGARREGYLGGAVLEYRMQFHQPLCAGDAFVHLAAVGDLGRKTQQISHLLYHLDGGALALSAEALGITLDLRSRKSIVIPDDRRVRLQALQRQPMALQAPEGAHT